MKRFLLIVLVLASILALSSCQEFFPNWQIPQDNLRIRNLRDRAGARRTGEDSVAQNPEENRQRPETLRPESECLAVRKEQQEKEVGKRRFKKRKSRDSRELRKRKK